MSESATTNLQTESVQPPQTQTPTAGKPRLNPAKRRRRIRRIIRIVLWALVLAALVVAGLWYYNTTQQADSDASAPAYTQAVAQQGSMDVNVYGSGTIAAANQPTVYAQTDGKLAEIRVSVGDAVSQGQILAVLQNDALDDQIASLEYDLWTADSTIASTSPGNDVLTVVAPSAGRVKQISAAVGDDALAVYRRLGSLAMLSTDGRMKVSLNVADDLQLTYNQEVIVTGEGFSLHGNVTDLFMQGTRAVVTVVDDTLPLDAPVIVTTAEGATVGQGTLEINKPMAVSAFGGTISAVRVNVGDKVYRKQTLFTLEDSPITLKVENVRIQRETAAVALEDARESRENLIVRAPVDGVIASVDATEGSDITSGTALCSILQGEEMTLTIAVDELDVVQVAEGQNVGISVDALPGLTLPGWVQKIAPVGDSSSGVTTYNVELGFDSAGTGVRPGMNASGEVQVAHVDNTLYVPVEALMTIANAKYVLVADGVTGQWGGASGANAYPGDGQALYPAAQAGVANQAAGQIPVQIPDAANVQAAGYGAAGTGAQAAGYGAAGTGNGAAGYGAAAAGTDAAAQGGYQGARTGARGAGGYGAAGTGAQVAGYGAAGTGAQVAAGNGAAAAGTDAAAQGGYQGARTGARGAGGYGAAGTGTQAAGGYQGAAGTGAQVAGYGAAGMGAQVAGYGAAGAGAQAVQGAGTGRQQAAGSAETTAVSGTLRAVTVGLINDTYAEILSGLNAGEVVLYQTTTSTSSSNGNRTRVSVMPMMGF